MPRQFKDDVALDDVHRARYSRGKHSVKERRSTPTVAQLMERIGVAILRWGDENDVNGTQPAGKF
jgi:hypothetical protein